jgi:hypothetical protein
MSTTTADEYGLGLGPHATSLRSARRSRIWLLFADTTIYVQAPKLKLEPGVK